MFRTQKSVLGGESNGNWNYGSKQNHAEGMSSEMGTGSKIKLWRFCQLQGTSRKEIWKGGVGGKQRVCWHKSQKKKIVQGKKWSIVTNGVGTSKKIKIKNAHWIYQQELVSDLGRNSSSGQSVIPPQKSCPWPLPSQYWSCPAYLCPLIIHVIHFGTYSHMICYYCSDTSHRFILFSHIINSLHQQLWYIILLFSWLQW